MTRCWHGIVLFCMAESKDYCMNADAVPWCRYITVQWHVPFFSNYSTCSSSPPQSSRFSPNCPALRCKHVNFSLSSPLSPSPSRTCSMRAGLNSRRPHIQRFIFLYHFPLSSTSNWNASNVSAAHLRLRMCMCILFFYVSFSNQANHFHFLHVSLSDQANHFRYYHHYYHAVLFCALGCGRPPTEYTPRNLPFQFSSIQVQFLFHCFKNKNKNESLS